MARKQQGRGKFGSGASRICAVAAAATAVEMAAQVCAVPRETRTIELRLDWLRGTPERIQFLAWLSKRKFPGNLIATCRRRTAGGRFQGDSTAELGWLMLAGQSGCQWCDLEMETLRELRPGALQKLPLPPRILLSVHDFKRMLPAARIAAARRTPGVDAVKVAARAASLQEALRLNRGARGTRNFVAVPMGEEALPARILALRDGSALAYAPIKEETAPGQVGLHAMLHLYRAHQLTRKTRIYGVIGDPVGHSLGPLLHNTGFIAKRLDAVYLPFLVHDLRDFLQAAAEMGVRGFSVTIPHKQAILRHLDECDPLAAEIGAVNTVAVRANGKLYGCNTDYVGLLRTLEPRLRLPGSSVLLLGAGGAARAAAFALSHAGALVSICARRDGKARELARAVGGEAVPRATLSSETFDAIVNTTPVGMFPHAGVSPLLPRELRCRVAMDMIYRPMKTSLLELASRKGCATVSGVEMFLAQGFAQWEIWTEQRAPEAAMRSAVLHTLREEERAACRGRRLPARSRA